MPITLVVADVDGLKLVNDVRGHAAGDALLRSTAAALRATFRAQDVVARIGGDEFAAVLEGYDTGDVAAVEARVEDAARRQGAEPGGVEVALSVGAAVAEAGVALTEVLRRADERMYANKVARRRRELPFDS